LDTFHPGGGACDHFNGSELSGSGSQSKSSSSSDPDDDELDDNGLDDGRVESVNGLGIHWPRLSAGFGAGSSNFNQRSGLGGIGIGADDDKRESPGPCAGPSMMLDDPWSGPDSIEPDGSSMTFFDPRSGLDRIGTDDDKWDSPESCAGPSTTFVDPWSGPNGIELDGSELDDAKPNGAKPDGSEPDCSEPDGAEPGGSEPDGIELDDACAVDDCFGFPHNPSKYHLSNSCSNSSPRFPNAVIASSGVSITSTHATGAAGARSMMERMRRIPEIMVY